MVPACLLVQLKRVLGPAGCDKQESRGGGRDPTINSLSSRTTVDDLPAPDDNLYILPSIHIPCSTTPKFLTAPGSSMNARVPVDDGTTCVAILPCLGQKTPQAADVRRSV
jgi:hypothetical protein